MNLQKISPWDYWEDDEKNFRMEPLGILIFKEWMDYQEISGDGGNW